MDVLEGEAILPLFFLFYDKKKDSGHFMTKY